VLAGGQSLVPLLALRLARPDHVIDVNRIPALDVVERVNGHLGVGALVRQEDALASSAFGEACPVASAALPHVGVPETRVRGTVVGSLTHADPAGELPTVAAALGAEVILRSAAGTRTVRADEFFVAPFMTARRPEELAVEVRFPVSPEGAGWSFREVARGPVAVVAVAAVLDLEARERVSRARIGLGGVDAVPFRAEAAEELVTGEIFTEQLAREAAETAAATLEPPADVLASAAYRRLAVAELTAEALREAAARAGADA
jgi:aerobic carbon-monoxide dehydrogenase medium subunit